MICFPLFALTKADLWISTVLIGIAFACQQADALTSEAWDVRLNAVVTEDGVLEFS